MPPKVKELIAQLKKEGFQIQKGRGKGSHIVLEDDFGIRIQLSGNLSKDAQKYHVRKTAAVIKQRQQYLKQSKYPKTAKERLAIIKARESKGKNRGR